MRRRDLPLQRTTLRLDRNVQNLIATLTLPEGPSFSAVVRSLLRLLIAPPESCLSLLPPKAITNGFPVLAALWDQVPVRISAIAGLTDRNQIRGLGALAQLENSLEEHEVQLPR